MDKIQQQRTVVHHLKQIPLGYSEVSYQGRKYSITRADFNSGKSTKVFAQELGGKDFISFNWYLTEQGEQLKPCEMPVQKVMDFLKNSQRS